MRILKQLGVFISTLAALAEPASAQTSFVSGPTGEADAPKLGEQDALGFRQGSVIVVPIPSQNPTFETGIAIGAGYIFRADEESANSFIGLGGYRSTNGSRVYGVSTSLSFSEDRWKISLTAAEMDLNYDLILFGSNIPLRQGGQFGSLELSYGFTSEFSVGVGARYLSTSITPNFNIAIPPEYSTDLSTDIASSGVLLNWDSRDDTFFSREGTKINLSLYHHDILDDPRDYQKAVVTLDGYMPVGDKHVVAGRFTACKVTEDAPFFDACALGAVDNFRGFSFSENIGEELASLQLSWRGTFGTSRFGYEFFAGTGRVYKTFPGAGDAKFRSAAGIGLKYRLTKKFPLDIALDVTLNDAGEDTTYIYIGQRF